MGGERKTLPPLLPDTLAGRIGAFMNWYDHRRPHSSLGCANPAGVYIDCLDRRAIKKRDHAHLRPRRAGNPAW